MIEHFDIILFTIYHPAAVSSMIFFDWTENIIGNLLAFQIMIIILMMKMTIRKKSVHSAPHKQPPPENRFSAADCIRQSNHEIYNIASCCLAVSSKHDSSSAKIS